MKLDESRNSRESFSIYTYYVSEIHFVHVSVGFKLFPEKVIERDWAFDLYTFILVNNPKSPNGRKIWSNCGHVVKELGCSRNNNDLWAFIKNPRTIVRHQIRNHSSKTLPKLILLNLGLGIFRKMYMWVGVGGRIKLWILS